MVGKRIIREVASLYWLQNIPVRRLIFPPHSTHKATVSHQCESTFPPPLGTRFLLSKACRIVCTQCSASNQVRVHSALVFCQVNCHIICAHNIMCYGLCRDKTNAVSVWRVTTQVERIVRKRITILSARCILFSDTFKMTCKDNKMHHN
jgi:hypothetical protein